MTQRASRYRVVRNSRASDPHSNPSDLDAFCPPYAFITHETFRSLFSDTKDTPVGPPRKRKYHAVITSPDELEAGSGKGTNARATPLQFVRPATDALKSKRRKELAFVPASQLDYNQACFVPSAIPRVEIAVRTHCPGRRMDSGLVFAKAGPATRTTDAVKRKAPRKQACKPKSQAIPHPCKRYLPLHLVPAGATHDQTPKESSYASPSTPPPTSDRQQKRLRFAAELNDAVFNSPSQHPRAPAAYAPDFAMPQDLVPETPCHRIGTVTVPDALPNKGASTVDAGHRDPRTKTQRNYMCDTPQPAQLPRLASSSPSRCLPLPLPKPNPVLFSKVLPSLSDDRASPTLLVPSYPPLVALRPAIDLEQPRLPSAIHVFRNASPGPPHLPHSTSARTYCRQRATTPEAEYKLATDAPPPAFQPFKGGFYHYIQQLQSSYPHPIHVIVAEQGRPKSAHVSNTKQLRQAMGKGVQGHDGGDDVINARVSL